jgi:hypothetical protein
MKADIPHEDGPGGSSKKEPVYPGGEGAEEPPDFTAENLLILRTGMLEGFLAESSIAFGARMSREMPGARKRSS